MSAKRFNNDKYLSMWLNMECIGIDDDGRLVSIDGATCDDPEQLLVAKYDDDRYAAFLRHDLDDNISVELLSMDTDKLFDGRSRRKITSIIPSDDIRKEHVYTFTSKSDIDLANTESVGSGEEYIDEVLLFAKKLSKDDLSARSWSNEDVVARAWTVRNNGKSSQVALEAYREGTKTDPRQKVLAAWVNAQLKAGLVPFLVFRFSQSDDLGKLAESVGGIKVAEVVSYQ